MSGYEVRNTGDVTWYVINPDVAASKVYVYNDPDAEARARATLAELNARYTIAPDGYGNWLVLAPDQLHVARFYGMFAQADARKRATELNRPASGDYPANGYTVSAIVDTDGSARVAISRGRRTIATYLAADARAIAAAMLQAADHADHDASSPE